MDWEGVFSFFLRHWGEFCDGIGGVCALSHTERSQLKRRLELAGHDLVWVQVDGFVCADLVGWLSWHIPDFWGPGEDIGRLAFVLECSTIQDFVLEFATFSQLAQRFPFPICVCVSPDLPWENWFHRHAEMFGEGAEVIATGDGVGEVGI